MLGGEISAHHTRENLVLGAKFLRDDLPYYLELLAEIASSTKFESRFIKIRLSQDLTWGAAFVLKEEVIPTIQKAHKKFLADVDEMAINSAHGLAFHRGLGTPLYPTSSTPVQSYINPDSVRDFANAAYSKSNFAIVANGAEQSEVSKWVNEFFPSVATGSQAIQGTQTKYFGGEERIAHGSGNSMVIAFAGSSSFTGGFYKPELQVIASLLGGQSGIKWSPGFSLLGKVASEHPGLAVDTKSLIYSDAGLLATTLKGPASYIATAAAETVKAIKAIAAGEVSPELFKKAKASAKFKELEFGQNISAGLELTGSGLITGSKAYQIDQTAQAIDAVTQEQVSKVRHPLNLRMIVANSI